MALHDRLGNRALARWLHENRTLERQADQMAARALAGPPAAAEAATRPPVQRAAGGLGAGRPLDEVTRATMERGFGEQFDDVRIHDDAAAETATGAAAARALTAGAHIAFDRGRFDPSSGAGRRLLAHELAHVIQQRWQPGLGPQRHTRSRADILGDLAALDQVPDDPATPARREELFKELAEVEDAESASSSAATAGEAKAEPLVSPQPPAAPPPATASPRTARLSTRPPFPVTHYPEPSSGLNVIEVAGVPVAEASVASDNDVRLSTLWDAASRTLVVNIGVEGGDASPISGTETALRGKVSRLVLRFYRRDKPAPRPLWEERPVQLPEPWIPTELKDVTFGPPKPAAGTRPRPPLKPPAKPAPTTLTPPPKLAPPERAPPQPTPAREPRAERATPAPPGHSVAERVKELLKVDLSAAARLASQLSDDELKGLDPTDRAVLLWALALNPVNGRLDLSTVERLVDNTPDGAVTALEDQLFAGNGLLLQRLGQNVLGEDRKRLADDLMHLWSRGELRAGEDDHQPRWMQGLFGEPVKVTRAQYDQMLKDAPLTLGRRLRQLNDEIAFDDRTRAWRNSVIGDIVDAWGGLTKPPTALELSFDPQQFWWRDAYGTVSYGLRLVDEGKYLEAGQQFNRAEAIARDLNHQWSVYREQSIEQGEDLVQKLEIVRDSSFAIAAGLGGAVAAPAVFGWVTAAGGGSVLAGGLAVGGGALAGGGIHGGLEFTSSTAGQKLFLGQVDWSETGGRTWSGFKSGLFEGAMGAGGQFANAGLAARFGPQFAGSFGGRVLLGSMVGGGSGLITSTVDVTMHPGDVLDPKYVPAWQRIGTGTVFGAATGGIFSALPVRGLYRTGGQPLNPFSGAPVSPRWMLASPWSPVQNNWNPPADFHLLPAHQLPPLPPEYMWTRMQGEWVPLRAPGVEQPLVVRTYGPDAQGRINYNVLSSGRLLGSSAWTRPSPTYGQVGGQRSEMPFGPADFVEPTSGAPSIVGHNVDFADTMGLPGVPGNSNADPLNYTPEAAWWGLRIRNPLVARIRAAGGGYRQMNFYGVSPQAARAGVPIPDGVFFVETNAAGQPINAWRIPFAAHPYTFNPGPGNAWATLAPFQIPLSQIPQVLLTAPPGYSMGAAGVVLHRPGDDETR